MIHFSKCFLYFFQSLLIHNPVSQKSTRLHAGRTAIKPNVFDYSHILYSNSSKKETAIKPVTANIQYLTNPPSSSPICEKVLGLDLFSLDTNVVAGGLYQIQDPPHCLH